MSLPSKIRPATDAKPYTLEGMVDKNGRCAASTITAAPMPTATGAARPPSAPSDPMSITEPMPTTAPNDMQTTVLIRPSALPPLWKKLAQATKPCHTCI